MSNSSILEKINESYDFALTIYEEKNILGVFVYDEDKIKVIYIPTFEELCFKSSMSSLIYNEKKDTIIVENICSLANNISFAQNFLKENNPKLINPDYIAIYSNFLENKNIENIDEIKAGIMEIIKMVVNNTEEEFLNQLTIAEKEGLKIILKTIGTEGVVSINNLSKDIGISRPVLNNLISKMKTAKVAIIQNMGAKGTYIKILNLKLIKQKGEN